MFKNLTIHNTLFKAPGCTRTKSYILRLPMGHFITVCCALLLVCFTTTTSAQISSGDITAYKSMAKEEEALTLRLMMVDATLELNEAMLLGVRASIDTLNLAENTANVQDKDMQVNLLRMKRARDKTLLMPFLEHMKDSLNEEISALRKEKITLEAMVKPAEPIQPVVLKTQTLVSKKDTLVFETTRTADGSEQTLVTNTKTNEKIVISDAMTASERKANERKLKKYKNLVPIDTILVFDAGTGPLKPEPEGGVTTAKNEKKKKAKAEKSAPLPQDTVIVFEDSAEPVVTAAEKKKGKDKPAKQDQIHIETEIEASDEMKMKAEFYLQRAMNAMSEKNYKNAETYLHKATQLYPEYYDAWYIWGEMDARNGMDSKALKEYQKGISIDSTQWLAYYKIGTIYMKTNRKTEALQAFDKAIRYNPDYIDALMQRAGIYAETSRGMDAIRDYDHVTSINRMYYKAYRGRGLAKMGFKLYSEAADDFTRSLIFEPDDAEAYYYRGVCRIGNHEVADGCLDLSIAQEKGYAAAANAIKKSCE